MRIVRLAAAAVAATIALTCCSTTAPQPAAPTTTKTPRQVVLPFKGLERPNDVVVDATGSVYVTDLLHAKDDHGFDVTTNQIIELPAGANAQRTLPITRSSLSVDSAGSVWAVDGGNNTLVKLAFGSQKQVVAPLPVLGVRGEILTVDPDGNAYGTEGGGVDSGGGCCLPVHVVQSQPGSAAPAVLPFTHIDGIAGMAVDTAGNVYVGDSNTDRVLELAPGSDTPTVLPFKDMVLADIAVNGAGDVYAVDPQHNRVLQLTAGSDEPTVLPFSGLNHPVSVAVDGDGGVYVVDGENRRVVALTGI